MEAVGLKRIDFIVNCELLIVNWKGVKESLPTLGGGGRLENIE